MTHPKTNLLDLNREALSQFCVQLGEPSYRATQLLRWIHHDGHTDFSTMN